MSDSAKKADDEKNGTRIEDNITMLSLSEVEADADQPRKSLDDKGISELSESIKANGLIHPILVRQDQGGKYIIVSGERRWLASQKAGLEKIATRLVHGDYEIAALSENLSRKALLAIEESDASAKLLSKMQGENAKAKQKELAARLGIAESTMSEILKPAELPKNIKEEALTSSHWSRFKLLKLAKIKDVKKQMTTFEEMRKAVQAKEKAASRSEQSPKSAEDKDSIQKSKEAQAAQKRVNTIK